MKEIVKSYVSRNKYWCKCPYGMVPRFITVHNTANDASAANEVKYMKSNTNKVSYHFAVDDKQIIQAIPCSRNAFHAGDGSGDGNRKSIGVEICYSKSGGARFDKAESNAAELIAYLMHAYDIPLSRVVRHKDWSGKDCPHRTIDRGWSRYKQMIEDAYNAAYGGADKAFRVRVLVDSLNIRTGAGVDFDAVGVITDKGTYTITAVKNGWGKLKSGAGWINIGASYCKRV